MTQTTRLHRAREVLEQLNRGATTAPGERKHETNAERRPPVASEPQPTPAPTTSAPAPTPKPDLSPLLEDLEEDADENDATDDAFTGAYNAPLGTEEPPDVLAQINELHEMLGGDEDELPSLPPAA